MFFFNAWSQYNHLMESLAQLGTRRGHKKGYNNWVHFPQTIAHKQHEPDRREEIKEPKGRKRTSRPPKQTSYFNEVLHQSSQDQGRFKRRRGWKHLQPSQNPSIWPPVKYIIWTSYLTFKGWIKRWWRCFCVCIYLQLLGSSSSTPSIFGLEIFLVCFCGLWVCCKVLLHTRGVRIKKTPVPRNILQCLIQGW